jgi:ribosomal 50S subunit-associated protein YjgA (DUF615 family)
MARFTIALSGDAALAKALGSFPETIRRALDDAVREAGMLFPWYAALMLAL